MPNAKRVLDAGFLARIIDSLKRDGFMLATPDSLSVFDLKVWSAEHLDLEKTMILLPPECYFCGRVLSYRSLNCNAGDQNWHFCLDRVVCSGRRQQTAARLREEEAAKEAERLSALQQYVKL